MTGRRARTVPIVVVAATIGTLLISSLGDPVGAEHDRRVIVLGIDGMDHRLLNQFIAEGRLPNFERLASTGSFAPLETTMPPLSPVAWSTFITGMDPGGHGIYDFLHRDPLTAEPLESIYQVAPPGTQFLARLMGHPTVGRRRRRAAQGDGLLGTSRRRRSQHHRVSHAGQFPTG